MNTKRNIILALLLGLSLGLPAQGLLPVAKTYYRSSPFLGEFSQFLQHLLNDPTLVNRKMNKRTDSLLFFLEGDYTTHRPFFFGGPRCRVILAEVQEETGDTLNPVFTHYAYQIIGYASPGEEGRRDVITEFDKLLKKNRKATDTLAYRELKNGGRLTGAIADLGYKPILVFPLSLAWASSQNGEENLLALTIRFLVTDNRAYFPVYQKRRMQESP